jgi:chorismate synthase
MSVRHPTYDENMGEVLRILLSLARTHHLRRLEEEIREAARQGDSLGGVAEVLVWGLPVGLGSHVHWDRKLDGLLAQAVMSIHAVKAVEIGDGFTLAARRGSDAHDAIVFDDDAATYTRTSDRAGGLEGGITTGEMLSVSAAMKPLATLNRPVLATVDTATNEPSLSFRERTDVTAVPAMGVVAESMVALTLATEVLRKFGGDSMVELRRNLTGFTDQVRAQTLATAESVQAPELNWDESLAFADPRPTGEGGAPSDPDGPSDGT